MQPLLTELTRRTGQTGAMDWLEYFTSSPDSLEKTPYLCLVPRAGADIPLAPDDIEGAVLIYEYRFAGLGTRVFATDDMIGIRTVIAPEEQRVHVAEVAIRSLMQSGAVIALISLDGPGGQLAVRPTAEVIASKLAMRSRSTARYLALGPTLDNTLSTLGKHTRRNLRCYRRKVESELGAEFVPCVRIDRREFLEMNRLSTNPAPDDVTQWRYEFVEKTGCSESTIFAGVRAADGRWLSLVGGRRYGSTTELDWQLNLGGLPRYSLCTVMRSYLMEHEIARGATRLVFQGGTPHPMRFAFTEAPTTDLLAVRRFSVRAWFLRKFSRQLFPEKNFLGAALRDFRNEKPANSRESCNELPDAA